VSACVLLSLFKHVTDKSVNRALEIVASNTVVRNIWLLS